MDITFWALSEDVILRVVFARKVVECSVVVTLVLERDVDELLFSEDVD